MGIISTAWSLEYATLVVDYLVYDPEDTHLEQIVTSGLLQLYIKNETIFLQVVTPYVCYLYMLPAWMCIA